MRASAIGRRVASAAGALVAGAGLAAASLSALQPREQPLPTTPSVLRYLLQPGDRLTYRLRLVREVQGPDAQGSDEDSEVSLEWRTDLVVLASHTQGHIVGFGRRRVDARMTRFRGGDPRVDPRKRFEEALAREADETAEANWILPNGAPRLPWRAAWASTSDALVAIHEIEPLSDQAVGPGDSWKGGGALGLDFKATAWRQTGSGPVLVIEGRSAAGRLACDFDPALGAIRRLEFSGTSTSDGTTVRERVTYELLERVRGERVEQWLEGENTRLAALSAMVVAEAVPVATEVLYRFLDTAGASPDAAPGGAGEAVVRSVLSLALLRDLAPPPLETLARLLGRPEPRVRALATRLLRRSRDTGREALLAQHARDADYFVREAARPRSSAAGAGEPRPPQKPGTTLRAMSSNGYRGWPYVLHVPDDYRGDESFPVLIYLPGGAGSALRAAASVESTIAGLGYLVVVPQAPGPWWEPGPARLVIGLLDEILRTCQVDPNRVFIAGPSNGGSGTLALAALAPHRFAAAVSLMGAGVTLPARDRPLLPNLGSLPVLFLHGALDRVIPASATRDTVSALRRELPGARVDEGILPGRGHDLLLGADDGRSVEFLQRHVRDPFPRSVRMELRTLEFPRHYWIEVLEKEEGLAHVTATIEEGNQVRLTTTRVKRLRLFLRRELVTGTGPIHVSINGVAAFEGPLVEDSSVLAEGVRTMGDPSLAYPMAIDLNVGADGRPTGARH